DIEAFVRSFDRLVWDETAAVIHGLEERIGRAIREEDVSPLTWWLTQKGRERSASEHIQTVAALEMAGGEAAGLLADHDLLLAPTTPAPPLPHELQTPTASDVERVWGQRELGGGIFLLLANVTGHPAMSIPVSWSADGLPVDCHFTGRYGREDVLLRLAGQL